MVNNILIILYRNRWLLDSSWWSFHNVCKCQITMQHTRNWNITLHQLRFNCRCSVAQSCPTLCDPTDCSTPGLPVLHHLPELAHTHVCWVGDAIQPPRSLSPPYPPASNLSQHQGLFQRVGSSYQVAKVLEFQPQHSSLWWIFRTDFL